MAGAKSDFAQKLLHDLKLRKERMAASQSSSHSNSTGRDAYRNSGQTYRRSRQHNALESVGSTSVNQRTRSSASNASFYIKESSQQVVSYGRNGSSEYVGDLSLAFAYALQNGGKGGKLDFSSKNSSMIDFLHQIGRRSLDMGKMERTGSFSTHRSSTSHFPALSQIHIKEISKGVQNLNQILRACSNGINFDKYSIEVGKELLKGAKGLEESLRMLVNLQEASDYMVSPQKKNQNRFTLLDEDEDEEDKGNAAKIVEQKQLDLPRFSFDKPSRNSHGTKEAATQRLMALTYSTSTPSLMSHTRSSSCVSDFTTPSTLSETKSSSSSVKSKSERGRISSVIAKLMGLEEVLAKVETELKRKAEPKKKDGMVAKNSTTSTKNAERNKVEVEMRGPMISDAKPIKRANKIQQTQINVVLLKAEEIELSSSASGGGEVPDRKQHKDFQSVNVMSGALPSNKASILAVDKRQSHIGRSNQIPGKGENGQNHKREHPMHTEQERTEKGDTKEVKDSLQESVGKKSKLQTETINEERLISNNHQRPQTEQGLHQRHRPSKLDQHNKRHGVEKSKQLMSKQNLHASKQDMSQINSKVSPTPVHRATDIQEKQTYGVPSKKSAAATDMMPSKELPDNKQNEDLSIKRESQKDLQTKQESKTVTEQPTRQEKPLHVQPTRKKEDSMYKRETPRKVGKVVIRRNVALDKLARPSKTQRSIMQELIKRSQEKMNNLKGVEQLNSCMSKELEHSIESGSNIQPLSGEIPIQEDDQWATASQYAGGDECQSPKVVQSLPSKDQSQNTASEVLAISNDQKDEGPDYIKDIEPMYEDSLQNLVAATGAYEGTEEITRVSHKRQNEIHSGSTQVVLTENEKRLKETLIKGHSFLNTAEALFKLNIPVGILHSEDHQHHDCETKLKLDCGNELMRRKARNQELIVHPYMKTVSINHTKMRSLDELVKQLYRDFESLTYYGRKAGDESDTADYLRKMLERDLQGKDQEVNGVWDFGWNEMMFPSVEKEDVTKDLVKHVLNGLIEEITQELLNVIIFV